MARSCRVQVGGEARIRLLIRAGQIADGLRLARSLVGRADARAGAVATVLESIQKGLKKRGEVSIVGFGTFRVKQRAARLGRNPRTGQEIKIKASKSVGFKAGKPLKTSV